MLRALPALAVLSLTATACSADERACERDADCERGQRCDEATGSCITGTPADAAPPDAAPPDTAAPPDGPWGCGAPAMTGGIVACAYTWTCKDGKRKLACAYDTVNNVYDCTCHDLARSKVDGTFQGPSQTCASGAETVRQTANKRCGWKLPGA